MALRSSPPPAAAAFASTLHSHITPRSRLAAALRTSAVSSRFYDSTSSGCCIRLLSRKSEGSRFVEEEEAQSDKISERPGRRRALALGVLATSITLAPPNSASFAAESKKGFQAVLDKKDGYSFLYPFGWQEVVIQGQDKVFKDVIEPLESVSVNLVETSKQDIRDLGPPQEVVEALIKKVLAPSSQKTKLIEAAERDVEGKAYYTFEFIAQAPNFTRHALGTISIGNVRPNLVFSNGKFYTLTTGANERRWEKVKDRLHTVIDSFKISNV